MRIEHLPYNGGGNCLFQSCAYHLKISPAYLRKKVALIIRSQPTLLINGTPLQEWVSMLGYDYISYSQYISKDGVLGTGLELAIISMHYHRCIKVMNPEFIQIAEYFPNFQKSIFLCFSGDPNNGHYDPIELWLHILLF